MKMNKFKILALKSITNLLQTQTEIKINRIFIRIKIYFQILKSNLNKLILILIIYHNIKKYMILIIKIVNKKFKKYLFNNN